MNECRDDVCITCSDQLLEAEVLSVADDRVTAQARIAGTTAEIDLALLENVHVGDHVLVHGGVALQAGTLGAPS